MDAEHTVTRDFITLEMTLACWEINRQNTNIRRYLGKEQLCVERGNSVRYIVFVAEEAVRDSHQGSSMGDKRFVSVSDVACFFRSPRYSFCSDDKISLSGSSTYLLLRLRTHTRRSILIMATISSVPYRYCGRAPPSSRRALSTGNVPFFASESVLQEPHQSCRVVFLDPHILTPASPPL